MTIIATLIHDGNVLMGADRVTADGNDQAIYPKRGKIVRKTIMADREMLVGTTGLRALSDIIAAVKIPDSKADSLRDTEYVVDLLVTSFRRACKMVDDSIFPLKRATDDWPEFCALIAVDGRVFRLDQVGSVLEPASEYSAVGHGDWFALGALYATSGLVKDPAVRMEIALRACERHDLNIRGPFDIELLRARDTGTK